MRRHLQRLLRKLQHFGHLFRLGHAHHQRQQREIGQHGLQERQLHLQGMLQRMRRGPGTSFAQTVREAFAEVRRPIIFATVIAVLAAMLLPALGKAKSRF